MDPEQRTHNPLVLASNPSGPTNQPVEATAVQKIGVTNRRRSIGRLKLFSQLFERRFLLQTSSERRIDRSYSDKTATVSVSNIPRAVWRVLPVGKPVRGVVESRAALADPG